MSKKNKKKKFRKPPTHGFRNAAPGVLRAPRPRAARTEDETPLKRLAYTAGGAAGTALAGSFLAHEGWAPKTIATALAAVGAGLAWKGDAATVRSVGAGVMSAAGSQLALMVMDDRDHKATTAVATATKKPSNSANALPAGALESALERAQARLALSARENEA
jgi:hypothetical protein